MDKIEALQEELNAIQKDIRSRHESKLHFFEKYRSAVLELLARTLEKLHEDIQDSVMHKNERVQQMVNSIEQQLVMAKEVHSDIFVLRGQLMEVLNEVLAPQLSSHEGEPLCDNHGLADVEKISKETSDCIEILNQNQEKYVRIVQDIIDNLPLQIGNCLNKMEKEVIESNSKYMQAAEVKVAEILEELTKARQNLENMEKIRNQIETFFLCTK